MSEHVTAELIRALKLIARDGCEHLHGKRCCEDPAAYYDEAEFWAERTCSPCIAFRTLKVYGFAAPVAGKPEQ